jgi:secreted trypsin-like serine protease
MHRALALSLIMTATLPASAILGGQKVSYDEFPSGSVVRLAERDNTTFCTGVFITPKHILTAAHCKKNYWSDTLVSFDGTSSNTLDIEKFISHPDFVSGKDMTPDLAVIVLRQPIRGVKTVELATMEIESFGSQKIHLMGFGITTKRKEDSVGSKLRHTFKNSFESENNLLVVNQKDFSGICSGDSGGPGIVEVNGKNYVLGINRSVDLTTPPCSEKAYLTRVIPFLSWITRTISEN